MEREPKNHGASLEIAGNKIELTPETSGAYVHHNMDEYDHLVVKTDEGWYRVFRKLIKNFDDVIRFMLENDFQVIVEDYPDKKDIDAYHETFGYPDPEPFKELTPRQERRIAFARYLLDNDLITADDFNEKLT